jgi:hypothetical protein
MATTLVTTWWLRWGLLSTKDTITGGIGAVLVLAGFFIYIISLFLINGDVRSINTIDSNKVPA